MKKITYIITRSDSIGGASVHLLDLIPAITKLGIETELLIGGKGIMYERALDLGINTTALNHLQREINLIEDYKAYQEIIAHLKKQRPDIVHLHSSKAGILGRLASKKLEIPCVFTAHGWAFTEGVSKPKRLLYKMIEKTIAPYANKIITVSEYDRELALQNGVGTEEQLIAIHNGVKNSTIPIQPKQDEKPCRLVMVARFDQPKNQAILLEALSRLSDLNWHLDLIGDGPNLQNCKNLARKLGLENNINFEGRSNEVEKFLSLSDIFVLTSNWEGFPLSILEAMRIGLPVIASDVGGVKEAVISGLTGYTVPRDDLDGLIQKLRELITKPSTRKKMGQEALNRYLEHFTFEEMIRKTNDVYNKLTDSTQ